MENMNNLEKKEQVQIAKPTNEYGIDSSIWSALKNSLYTGAKDASILMVLDYCKAGKLDPMQKPVHIVPMNIKIPGTRNSEWRDIIMPGIGLYRIQAARSGQYAGVVEPEYGEDVTTTFGQVKITYPKWCKVTVKKIIDGIVVEFSAKEYWMENVAIASQSQAPNAMWSKRPYGQLAKCTEAQALRKAFPEFVSQHPTAEEMEGKSLNIKDDDKSQKIKKVEESKSEEVEVVKELIGLCKDNEIDAGKFATFHNINSNDKETVKNGIMNFFKFKEQFLNVANTVTQ